MPDRASTRRLALVIALLGAGCAEPAPVAPSPTITESADDDATTGPGPVTKEPRRIETH